MNNKLFLGFLIGFVILLVIFIIILLTTEDNNNLIKSIGSSILILFGGSLIGYTTYSNNNKCKCDTNEIKGSGFLSYIKSFFISENNILELAKNTLLPNDEENLIYDIPISDDEENNINNQYIDNILKTIQEIKELVQVQENLQNVQETIEPLINRNKQLNNDKINIFNTKILPEFEKNLQTLISLVTNNRNNLTNINDIENYINDASKLMNYLKTNIDKKYDITNINVINNDINVINNNILDKINEVNNILKENNNLKAQDVQLQQENKKNIEQTNIVQTEIKDNLQKIKEIEKKEIENKLIIVNTLKNLVSQIEINKDLTDDNINKISEMITNIEKEPLNNIQDIKQLEEDFLKESNEIKLMAIEEKAKYLWKPSSLKELQKNINNMNNNIENKIKENTTKITSNINNIITYNCNYITNLFNTIKNKTIPVANDAKLKMIKQIYNNINSKEMNTKDCKFIEDNLTEINNLIDFYNKNKKDDKLNKISIKDGKINIDSTDIASTPAFESPTKSPTPASTTSAKTAAPSLTAPAPASASISPPASTSSSSLGSSLPTNLSGLPIIAPALKYKDSEKKDTSFDKYLAKLLSSSI